LQGPSVKEKTIRRVEVALRVLFFLSILLFSTAVVYFAQVESRNWHQKMFLVLLPLVLIVALSLIRRRLLRSDSS
jgi:membrane protein YdbS with pleckstrin-like domain